MLSGLKHRGMDLKNFESQSLLDNLNVKIEQEITIEKVINNTNQVGRKKQIKSFPLIQIL